MTHVARSISHELHYMDGKYSKPFSNVIAKVNWRSFSLYVNLGTRYFDLEDVGFQLQKIGTIQMHMLQSIGINGRVEHLQCMP